VAATRILIGLDGSQSAQQALEWCVHIAPRLDAEVIAVYAFEHPVELVPPSGLPLAAQYDDAWRARQRHELDATWCKTLRDAKIPFRSEIVDGAPAEALVQAAEAEHADLLVVGRRADARFTEAVLGSVPHHLAHHVTTPVVIVPMTHAT
jgi:nucleotide-binding universal stress UspA family protein